MFRPRFYGGLAVVCAVLPAVAGAKAEAPYDIAWIRQLGTSDSDEAYDVSADGLGNVYLGGYTLGSLGGPNAGSDDAFVSKYDARGDLLWTRQLGTTDSDWAEAVSADGLGNVYVGGYTYGSLGGPNLGDADAFVSKYDASGNLLWTRQLGTSGLDSIEGVSADGLGNVYLGGYTQGSLGGPNAGSDDAFVSKYTATGDFLWTRQLGTTDSDRAEAVSADGLGNVYVGGATQGSLDGPNAGDADAFVSKYDDAGHLLWTRQLGTSGWDSARGVSADGLGHVYLGGYTHGSLGGPNAGLYDAFVSQYDDAGSLLWTRQLGTTRSDGAEGVSADGLGNVYVAGPTYGSLGGPSAGYDDAFVAELVVPEPGSLVLLISGGLCLLACARRKRRTR